MSQEYKDIVKAKRDKTAEVIRTKLSLDEIRDLYEYFNVDDDVHISKEGGVVSLKPFGMDGPDIKSHDSIEVYALDRFAREFAQRLVRVRFSQLLDTGEEKPKKVKKDNTPK